MCGIVGYIGAQQAQDILLDGLSRLEYRGYDSAGIAVMDGGIITVNTETAAALGIDYSAFNDLAGQVVEVTTAE